MGKHIHFFMTKDDLLLLSKELESKIDVRFYDNLNVGTKNGRCFSTLKDIPNLGNNESGAHHMESFTVIPMEKEVEIEEVKQRDGTIHYLIHQGNNVDSIEFWPGGFYDASKLICGELATISDSEISKKLYNCFCKEIKKICSKRKGVFLYSQNVEKLSDIRLITININELPMYDLLL